jgi:ERCC4-type nuclease
VFVVLVEIVYPMFISANQIVGLLITNKPDMTSQWTLHIDCAEKNAATLAEELTLYGLKTKVSNLEVADFWFEKDGKVWCAIERKKMDDLLSSIIDGRYNDQRARLLKSEVPHLFFLIVGSIESLESSDKKRVNSAILHLQMYKNLKVAYIDHEGYTKPFFVELHQYLCNDPNLDRITAPSFEHIQINCKKRKLDNHKDVYTAQLMCVQGISEDKANAIRNSYPDLAYLMKSYENTKDEKQRAEMLKDLQAGKKKLGPVASERIYRCIMNKPAEDPSLKRHKTG